MSRKFLAVAFAAATLSTLPNASSAHTYNDYAKGYNAVTEQGVEVAQSLSDVFNSGSGIRIGQFGTDSNRPVDSYIGASDGNIDFTFSQTQPAHSITGRSNTSSTTSIGVGIGANPKIFFSYKLRF